MSRQADGYALHSRFPLIATLFYRGDAMTAMVRDERVRNLIFVGIFKDGCID
jgi:hypothetical protein